MTEITHLYRRDATDTSRMAAESIDVSALESMVLSAIRQFTHGCIQDDILLMFPDRPYSSVTARFRALLDKGLIVDTGSRRPGKSGRLQRVITAHPIQDVRGVA